MARRASSSIHPAWVGAVLVLIACAVLGGYLLVGRVNDPYRTVPALDISMYLENSNSLRGNTYKVTGTVWNSLAWSPKSGRLFSIEVANGAGGEMLPVLVPAAFNHVNIQKGQRFIFKIEVDEHGVPRVKDLDKV